MSLIKTFSIQDSPFQPYLNTGTLYDIQTGKFVPGLHGGMILNGGIASTNAASGREQMFKSTLLFSLCARAMAFYPLSESFTLDTEFAQKKERHIRFSPYADPDELDNRMRILMPSDITPEDFFEMVKKIAANKLDHRQDYLVESPFYDVKTSKPIMMFIPTFIIYDSWSKLMSSFMQTTLNTKEIGSSDTNMIYMRDGNIKKMMLVQIPMIAARAGLYFVFSAHIGNKYELNPYAKSARSLQYMKSSEKQKEVGSDFNFLISNSIEMRKVQVMQDDKKECLYPSSTASDTELNEVTEIMLRCKNNVSGTQLPLVISQDLGIMSDLSNYHYLRENEYFGLIGNKSTHKVAVANTPVSRLNIREKLVDPKLARALEILAQLCYVQNNWTLNGEVDLSIKPEALAEKLLASDHPTAADILQSRGYWTYDKNNIQPYLSLYDICAIAQGVYQSKQVSLVGMSPIEAVPDKTA